MQHLEERKNSYMLLKSPLNGPAHGLTPGAHKAPLTSTRPLSRECPVDPEISDTRPFSPYQRDAAAPTEREVFDTESAASYLMVSRQLLELLRVTGGGPPFVKFRRLVRYRKSTLDQWMAAQEKSSTSER